MTSFTVALLSLMEKDKDFAKQLQDRLILEAKNVKNPISFIIGLYTEGALSDGSIDPEEITDLKSFMVKLAIRIAGSKGTDVITTGLMRALERSGNQQLISVLHTWVMTEFAHLVEQPEADPIVQPEQPQSSNRAKEISSIGIKLIDKIISQMEDEFKMQLKGQLVGNVPNVVNIPKFRSTLVQLKVLDERQLELEAGRELGDREWAKKAVQVACAKQAFGSLLYALQCSNNERFLNGTNDWLEFLETTRKHYPIAVKSLEDERKISEFFEQAPPSDCLTSVASFRCRSGSSKKGPFALEFNREKMVALLDDGSVKLWDWITNEETRVKFVSQVKNVTWFQLDEEILVMGTAEGTVHLLDALTSAEKSRVKFEQPVDRLKFFGTTLVVVTQGDTQNNFWWLEIDRAAMELQNQKFLVSWPRAADRGFLIHRDYSVWYDAEYFMIYDMKSGRQIVDDQNRPWWCKAPAGITTVNVVDLITTKRNVIFGCQDGQIVMFDTRKFIPQQEPVRSFQRYKEAIVSLCPMSGNLFSLDQGGKLVLWPGYRLEDTKPTIVTFPCVLAMNFDNATSLVAHEHWIASGSSEDGVINIWAIPESFLSLR